MKRESIMTRTVIVQMQHSTSPRRLQLLASRRRFLDAVMRLLLDVAAVL